MLNLMKQLVAPRAVSGCEKIISDKLLPLIAPLTDKVWSDAMGNLIALKKGTAPEGEAKKIMLCAHMDEIGFMVTHIDDKGFIRVAPIGGINPVAAAYAPVTFASGVKGVMVLEAGTAVADIKTDKLYVDIGAKDKKEAERRVKIGDYCALEGGITRLLGRRIAGRPLDDRIGCAMLIKIAEALKDAPCAHDVYFVFSVQEEVGVRGSKTATFGIMPDVGIAYDVTLTGDTVGAKPMACAVGDGAAIKIKDASVLCDRTLVDELTAVAKENDIKHQFEILLAGGTDTSSMQMTGAGCRAAALSVPTRYVHSGVEMLDLSDAQACVDLTVAWLRK